MLSVSQEPPALIQPPFRLKVLTARAVLREKGLLSLQIFDFLYGVVRQMTQGVGASSNTVAGQSSCEVSELSSAAALEYYSDEYVRYV